MLNTIKARLAARHLNKMQKQYVEVADAVSKNVTTLLTDLISATSKDRAMMHHLEILKHEVETVVDRLDEISKCMSANPEFQEAVDAFKKRSTTDVDTAVNKLFNGVKAFIQEMQK